MKQFSVRSLAVLLLMLGLAFLSGCSEQKVQTVKEETEANRILDVLLASGLSASKREVANGDERSYEIVVAGGEDEFKAAIQLMDDHCLPQPVPPPVESSGLVSSLEVEKARELRRIKINIESQLRNFPGVTCVDVNLVQPEDKSLSLDPYPASATVLVKHKSEKFGLNVDQIGRMVAGGVPGLKPDKVFVTLTKSPPRPLPDIDRGRNLRRILWVVGIGFTTILLFVALAWAIRKRTAGDELYDSSRVEGLTEEELSELESGNVSEQIEGEAQEND
ncbi:MAG: hypothetical protein HKN33_04570 [Pyrinomonadaceae bacterium]|nr:hypothetical protein [Pyrinomonadaceae bacterium]